jgi:hypothetical protein
MILSGTTMLLIYSIPGYLFCGVQCVSVPLSPSKLHWEVVKRNQGYVKATLNTGLTIHKSLSLGISIFTHAD